MQRQVFARVAPVFVIVAAVTASLSGCASGAEAGRVIVEVRDTAGADSYDVSVLDADDKLVDSREVLAGSSATFEEVPLGWVSVEAASSWSSCDVESELTSQHLTLRLVIDMESCAITN